MKNLEKYQSLLAGGAVDALLLTSQVSRMYAAQYDVAEGVAVIGREKSYYFTDSRYIEVAENNLPGFTVQEVNRENTYFARINSALETLSAKTLGIEEQYLTYGEFWSMKRSSRRNWCHARKRFLNFDRSKKSGNWR